MSKSKKYREIAKIDARSASEERLRISFEYIDWDSEEFFFHGLEVKYYQKFFDCLSKIQNCREVDILQQRCSALRPKSIFNSSSSIRKSFPSFIIEKIQENLFVEDRDKQSSRNKAKEIVSRAFEVSLSRNYGRVHGFLWNNIFHIVWIDPAHNLYPMKSGITKHRDAATVRSFAPDENLRLQAKIQELIQENAELLEAFANLDLK